MSVAPAVAGIVQTNDGQSVSGHVVLEAPGNFSVTAADGSVRRIAADDVSWADLTDTDANALTGKDVGTPLIAGSSTTANGRVNLHAAGWGIWTSIDSFYFLHGSLDGDGQVLAHIIPRAKTEARLSVGVMLRESLDPTAKFALSLVSPAPTNRFVTRPWRDIAPTAPDAAPPVAEDWVRLTRSKNTIAAYRSKDGHYWEEMGRSDIDLPPKVLAGICAFSAVNAPGEMDIDGVWIGQGAPESTLVPRTPLPPSGLVMNDGSTLQGTISQLSADTITITSPDGHPLSRPRSDVAWIVFQPACPNLTESMPNGACAVTGAGDAVEGEVAGLADGVLTVNSILFGPKTFEVGKGLAAVVLRQPKQWGPWFVRTKDGIQHTAAKLAVDGTSLQVGEARFPIDTVIELFAIRHPADPSPK